MIVVIGSPLHARSDVGSRAAGLSAGVARAAAAAGAEVQLVGKVGEDPAGEAVLLELARVAVGHAAILRDPSAPTGEAPAADPDEPDPFAEPDEANPAAEPEAGDVKSSGEASPVTTLSLEAADLELALRYLPDYRVVVVAEPLAAPALDVVVAGLGWSGAALVAIVAPGAAPTALPQGSTVLEAPATDPDDAFAGVVGAFAAALDRGDDPAAAWAAVSATTGWSAVAD